MALMMGCGDQCPLIRTKRREDWDIPDPKDLSLDEFREIRNQIEQKVKKIISAINNF